VREVGWDTECRPPARAAQRDRGNHQQLLEQPIAREHEDRRRESEGADGQPGDADRTAPQDAVPGTGGPEAYPREGDQAARELLALLRDLTATPAGRA
jgi:hypothetical protein